MLSSLRLPVHKPREDMLGKKACNQLQTKSFVIKVIDLYFAKNIYLPVIDRLQVLARCGRCFQVLVQWKIYLMHYLQMTAANRSMQFNYKNLLIVIYHLNDIYRSKQHLTHKKKVTTF